MEVSFENELLIRIAELEKEVERYKKIATDYRSFACVCKFDDDGETILEMCAAHRAKEKQLRSALEKIANDPRYYGNLSGAGQFQRIAEQALAGKE